MATTPQLSKGAASGFPWGRLWFLLAALVVYRIGAHIPVPGIDPAQLFSGSEIGAGMPLRRRSVVGGGALKTARHRSRLPSSLRGSAAAS